MIRSASEVLHDLEARVARLEGRTASRRTAAGLPAGFEDLYCSDMRDSKNGYEIVISSTATGEAQFKATVSFNGPAPKFKSLHGMTLQDVQNMGMQLQKYLGADSPVQAWVAVFDSVEKRGQLLSDPKVLRQAKDSV